MTSVKSYFKFSKFEFTPKNQDKFFTKEEKDFLTNTMIYDKYAHFIRDFFIAGFISTFLSIEIGSITAILFILLWETKDATLHIKNCPPQAPQWAKYLYGNGFSISDTLAGLYGIFFHFLIYSLAHNIYQNKFFYLLLLFLISSLLYAHCVKISNEK